MNVAEVKLDCWGPESKQTYVQYLHQNTAVYVIVIYISLWFTIILACFYVASVSFRYFAFYNSLNSNINYVAIDSRPFG